MKFVICLMLLSAVCASPVNTGTNIAPEDHYESVDTDGDLYDNDDGQDDSVDIKRAAFESDSMDDDDDDDGSSKLHPGEAINYKYDKIDAKVSKFRDPEAGDITKTAISYLLFDRSGVKGSMVGYRTSALADDGTRSGNIGASLDLKHVNGSFISFGASRPDENPDNHVVLHLAGKARVYDTPKTRVDLDAQSSHIVGGDPETKNKNAVKLNVGLTQKFKK